LIFRPQNADGGGEAVSRTLDFGFADFSTAQAFRALAGLPEFKDDAVELNLKAAELEGRAKRAVESCYDVGLSLMVPKDRVGRVVRGFNPNEWGKGFTEGNSWHHSFPPYAIGPDGNNRLVELHGGEQKLLSKLRQILTVPGKFMVGSYGQVRTLHYILECLTLCPV
jgi:putative alpha-1,2-mannosidase